MTRLEQIESSYAPEPRPLKFDLEGVPVEQGRMMVEFLDPEIVHLTQLIDDKGPRLVWVRRLEELNSLKSAIECAMEDAK